MREEYKKPKTIKRKLLDLNSHIFLLRENLYKINESEAYLKALSAELRVLICFSSGTEGFLWRMVDEFKVPDNVYLHLAGKVDLDHLLAKGLEFALIPMQHGGLGDPRLAPDYYSLREVIKKHEAVFISGRYLTHEYLIKAIAQQMGSAHEDDGLEIVLADISKIFANGSEPYKKILAIDAELTIQIAERVFNEAEKRVGFLRKQHSQNYGDLSVAVRFVLKQKLAGKIQLFKAHSVISSVDIICDACPQSLLFTLKKKENIIREIIVKYSNTLQNNNAVLFSYCSRAKKYHIVINGNPQDDDGIDCDIGWFHAEDFRCELISNHEYFVEGGILLYGRLLNTSECLEVLKLPPNLYGLWKSVEELKNNRVFPI